MRKYTETALIYFKAQLIWRADTVFNMLFTVTKIIFAYVLWDAIFEGKEMIAGFTFHSMLSYYIISSFLSQIEMSGGISREISSRIRTGTFSKYMVIPVNIEKYFLAMETGWLPYCCSIFLRCGVDIYFPDTICFYKGHFYDCLRGDYGNSGPGFYGTAQLLSGTSDSAV